MHHKKLAQMMGKVVSVLHVFFLSCDGEFIDAGELFELTFVLWDYCLW